MHPVSTRKAAGDGRKRGDFMFMANCSPRGVPDTVFGDAIAVIGHRATGVFRMAA
jgi:hypothetical protein